MTTTHKPLLLATVLAAFSFSASAVDSPVQRPGYHPAYDHALTDLRDAHWYLEHRPADKAATDEEKRAVFEIDKAEQEAIKAAADDGKSLKYTPREDAKFDRSGYLSRAAELLKQAQLDLKEEEDNPEAKKLRDSILWHVSAALQATESAVKHAGESR